MYISEPPTKGKILLITTLGEFDIELWSKEAPLACRNFVQLCMEKYYNGTIFHRVVRNFCAQGGDPTGTGEGGESIYGKPFKDEFHQRLKFTRRGLVAMANGGKNDNGSQFFFTLDRADELNNKHTIFGKVTGHTLYNLPKFNDLQTDKEDRPFDAPKITRTEILSNPFDDIVPRDIGTKFVKPEKQKPQSQSQATKNFGLLSFGDEAEEEEDEIEAVGKDMKIKSSHDVLREDPKLSSQTVLGVKGLSEHGSADTQDGSSEMSLLLFLLLGPVCVLPM
jgi:peptidyl-prolyl cis-trans isomerase SDCCAG10